jgi:TetR/AcrR family hemagglutinin/protease transcriptional regulator
MSAAPSSGARSRRRLPPEERRAQLLAIAVDVFAERGIGAARHAEIAERAGVAVSTAFVYFPTREQLVEDVLDEVGDFFLARLEQVHGQEKPCASILREIGNGFVELLRTHRSFVLVWLEWGAAVREEVWPRYRAFTERVVAITRRTLERGQRARSLRMPIPNPSRACSPPPPSRSRGSSWATSIRIPSGASRRRCWGRSWSRGGMRSGAHRPGGAA